jgi:hypothetical protein
VNGDVVGQFQDLKPAAPASTTLLKELLRQRHLKYETFCAEYERTAAQITADGVPPSRAQYYRWLSGQLKGGMPHPTPAACWRTCPPADSGRAVCAVPALRPPGTVPE